MGYDFFLVFKGQRLQKSTAHSYEILNALDFRLFQRLANYAIKSSAVLPVMNYLPRRGTMRNWTWFSRLTWFQMNEHILHCTTMGQRTLKGKNIIHYWFAFYSLSWFLQNLLTSWTIPPLSLREHRWACNKRTSCCVMSLRFSGSSDFSMWPWDLRKKTCTI